MTHTRILMMIFADHGKVGITHATKVRWRGRTSTIRSDIQLREWMSGPKQPEFGRIRVKLTKNTSRITAFGGVWVAMRRSQPTNGSYPKLAASFLRLGGLGKMQDIQMRQRKNCSTC